MSTTIVVFLLLEEKRSEGVKRRILRNCNIHWSCRRQCKKFLIRRKIPLLMYLIIFYRFVSNYRLKKKHFVWYLILLKNICRDLIFNRKRFMYKPWSALHFIKGQLVKSLVHTITINYHFTPERLILYELQPFILTKSYYSS